MTKRQPSSSLAWLLALSLSFPALALRAADSSTAAPAANAAPLQASPSEGAAPSSAPAAGTMNTPAPTTAAPDSSTPAAPPAADTERPTTYTVVSGDTLWGLSHKFDTSIKALKKENHLKKNNLKPGQVLKIPAATK